MEAPTLPHYFVMRPVKMQDLQTVTVMVNKAYEFMTGRQDTFKDEEFREEWGTPGFNLEDDTRLVLSPQGQVVGYIEVWDLLNPAVRVNIWGHTHPDFHGQGIGSALVKYGEIRATRALERAPADARVVIQSAVMNIDRLAQELFFAQGYSLVRHIMRMVIDFAAPPDPPIMPAGVRIRPMQPGEEENVIRTQRDSFLDHWNFVITPFDEEMRRWRHYMQNSPDYDPSLWFVAEDAGKIAGIALCRKHAYDDPELGWVQSLGVLPPWRRRGVGLALLQHAFVEHYQRGKRRAGLNVDTQNLTGATRLYERAGMHSDPSKLVDFYERELRPGVELRTHELAQNAQPAD